MLRARGIGCELFEQSDCHPRTRRRHHTCRMRSRTRRSRAITKLDDIAIRTDELYYLIAMSGSLARIRGIDAGHDVPQFSIQSRPVQSVIHAPSRSGWGRDAYTPAAGRASARTKAACPPISSIVQGSHTKTVRGDILIGATHSFAGARDPVSG